MTDSEVASNFKESKLKFEGRQLRFLNSKRWTVDSFSHKIKQGPFDIEIFENEREFSLKINGKKSKIKHETLNVAKAKVFEVIEDGQLVKFFKDNNFNFDKQKKKSKTKKTSVGRNL